MTDHIVLILAGMAVLIIFATAIGKDAGEMNREHGRNLELEHKLGGHRETAAWGCSQCNRGERS